MSHLPILRHNKNCFQEMDSVTFISLLKPNFMQRFRQNLLGNLEKTVLKTDGRTDGRAELNPYDPQAEPGVQKET